MIKTGLDYRWTRFSTFQGAYGGGTFTFNQGFTQTNYLTADSSSGNGIASALLGYAASGEVDTLPSPAYSWKYYAPWIQDDIKITPKLTVNAGLRWDLQMPVTERHNRLNRGFFPDSVNPISSRANQTVYGGIGFVAANGASKSPFNVQWANLQPRVGAAYQLRPNTVLRGGWGKFYATQFSTGSNYGFTQVTPYVATLNAGQTPASVISNPFPGGILQPQGPAQGLETLLGQGLSYSNTSGHIGYVYSFSFGVEQELPGELTLDISYAGTRSEESPVSRSVDALPAKTLALGNPALGGNPAYLNAQVPNPFQGLIPGTSLNSATITRQQSLLPYPEFTSVTENDLPVGKVWYNSLQVTALKHYSHGLNLTGTYTFSKNIQALSYLNPQDATVAHTAVPWDRTHRLVLAPIYDFPIGPGKMFLGNTNRVVGRLIGGWQTMMVYTWQTGAPMTAPVNTYVIGNPVLPNPTWNHMFNSGLVEANGSIVDTVPGHPPAFQVQPPFSLRTSPLYFGNLRDRWGNEFQITLAKNTRIRENMNLQIRAEAFNALNHPIFGSDPVINPTSPQFGQLVRSNGQSNIPREIQLAARFIF